MKYDAKMLEIIVTHTNAIPIITRGLHPVIDSMYNTHLTDIPMRCVLQYSKEYSSVTLDGVEYSVLECGYCKALYKETPLLVGYLCPSCIQEVSKFVGLTPSESDVIDYIGYDYNAQVVINHNAFCCNGECFKQIEANKENVYNAKALADVLERASRNLDTMETLYSDPAKKTYTFEVEDLPSVVEAINDMGMLEELCEIGFLGPNDDNITVTDYRGVQFSTQVLQCDSCDALFPESVEYRTCDVCPNCMARWTENCGLEADMSYEKDMIN